MIKNKLKKSHKRKGDEIQLLLKRNIILVFSCEIKLNKQLQKEKTKEENLSKRKNYILLLKIINICD